jgi:hypothetical protein
MGRPGDINLVSRRTADVFNITALRKATARLIPKFKVAPIDRSADLFRSFRDIFGISVEPADIYGTGRMPQRIRGVFAINARWELAALGGAV